MTLVIRVENDEQPTTPTPASAGLGEKNNRTTDVTDAVQNGGEITPADPSKGVVVNLQVIGGPGGSNVFIGSWAGSWALHGWVPEGKDGSLMVEFAAGETYNCYLDGATFGALIERTRG